LSSELYTSLRQLVACQGERRELKGNRGENFNLQTFIHPKARNVKQQNGAGEVDNNAVKANGHSHSWKAKP